MITNQQIIDEAVAKQTAFNKLPIVDRLQHISTTKGTAQYDIDVCIARIAGCHGAGNSPSLKSDASQQRGWIAQRDKLINDYRQLTNQ